jgi:hypothetical protein
LRPCGASLQPQHVPIIARDRGFRPVHCAPTERGDDERDDPGADELNGVWSRLEAWPDSVAGLGRLRRRFVTSTLSNAGMATMVAVVKHAGCRSTPS